MGLPTRRRTFWGAQPTLPAGYTYRALRTGSRLDFCQGKRNFFTCLDEQPLTENVAASRTPKTKMRYVRDVMVFPGRFRAIGIDSLPAEGWTLRNEEVE
jgi:hypothetical protein